MRRSSLARSRLNRHEYTVESQKTLSVVDQTRGGRDGWDRLLSLILKEIVRRVWGEEES